MPKTWTSDMLHRRLSAFLQVVIFAGLVWALLEQRWLTVFLVVWILLLTALPLILRKRLRVFVPPEFEFVAIVFLFASLFLGSVHGYYERYWWWDVMLHAGSGLLLGVVGFLLVYILNQEPEIKLRMRPSFVALFAFVFSVAIGALWEIYEFAMDQAFGMNMQKSGLVDTMWDLIVDTVGAACVSGAGYVYMRTGQQSFIEDSIAKFIDENPRLFGSG